MYALVTITAGSEDEADAIATALVERRLAACVQTLPIRSRYRWKGDVTVDVEVLLLVKTRENRFADLCAAVTELHSYEVPEIVLVPIAVGSPPYLAWIDEALGA